MCKGKILDHEFTMLKEKYEREKKARIYYQEKVYATCRTLDVIDGYRVASGKGIVCGTAETPTDQLEKRLEQLAKETPRQLQEYRPGTYCNDIKCPYYNSGNFSERCDECDAFLYYLWLKDHGYELVDLT